METILIFTDYVRIKQCQQNYEINWDPQTDGVKKIKLGNRTFIIAWDGISKTSALADLIEIGEIYILYHNKPAITFLNLLREELEKKECKVTLSSDKNHESEEYMKIQTIDASVRNSYSFESPNEASLVQVFEELKKMLEVNTKLESALVFLHSCLLSKPDNLIQLKGFDFQKPCTIGKAKDININTLCENLSPNPIDNIVAFEALRDGVLEMAGVK
jgi:hypothetical protein